MCLCVLSGAVDCLAERVEWNGRDMINVIQCVDAGRIDEDVKTIINERSERAPR